MSNGSYLLSDSLVPDLPFSGRLFSSLYRLSNGVWLCVGGIDPNQSANWADWNIYKFDEENDSEWSVLGSFLPAGDPSSWAIKYRHPHLFVITEYDGYCYIGAPCAGYIGNTNYEFTDTFIRFSINLTSFSNTAWYFAATNLLFPAGYQFYASGFNGFPALNSTANLAGGVACNCVAGKKVYTCRISKPGLSALTMTVVDLENKTVVGIPLPSNFSGSVSAYRYIDMIMMPSHDAFLFLSNASESGKFRQSWRYIEGLGWDGSPNNYPASNHYMFLSGALNTSAYLLGGQEFAYHNDFLLYNFAGNSYTTSSFSSQIAVTGMSSQGITFGQRIYFAGGRTPSGSVSNKIYEFGYFLKSPTGVTCSYDVDTNSIYLEWTIQSDDQDFFAVYRSIDDGDYVEINTTLTNNYTDILVLPIANKYSYKIRAIKNA